MSPNSSKVLNKIDRFVLDFVLLLESKKKSNLSGKISKKKKKKIRKETNVKLVDGFGLHVDPSYDRASSNIA